MIKSNQSFNSKCFSVTNLNFSILKIRKFDKVKAILAQWFQDVHFRNAAKIGNNFPILII